jgi:hypothetical protein
MTKRAGLLLFAVLLCSEISSQQKPAYYSFHNNFWVNLHHSLLYQARAEKLPPEQRREREQVLQPSEPLSQQEQETWTKAVQFYAQKFADRRALFDDELIGINLALSRNMDPSALGSSSDLPADVVEILKKAAPIYQRHWWALHRQRNQEWIASMEPRVNEFAPRVIPHLEQLFKSKWPGEDPIDVAYVVPEIGSAYTTLAPSHTTLASSLPEHYEWSGLEIVFHEGGHSLTGPLQEALKNECSKQHKECGDLWHAVLFFTVGEVLREELQTRGVSNYTPYAENFGLYGRGRWKEFLPLLEKHWSRYLQGKVGFDEALTGMVSGLGSEPERSFDK